jgi:hypothetical protein
MGARRELSDKPGKGVFDHLNDNTLSKKEKRVRVLTLSRAFDLVTNLSA